MGPSRALGPKVFVAVLGLAAGILVVWSFLSRQEPPPPAPSPAAPRAGAFARRPAPPVPPPNATPPPRKGLPEAAREETISAAIEAIVAEQAARLATRLPLPRKGVYPHDPDRTFHARLRGHRVAVKPTGLARTPYEAEAIFDIDWFSGGAPAGPQEIVASYVFDAGTWRFADAHRRVGGERVLAPEDRAWIRGLFE